VARGNGVDGFASRERTWPGELGEAQIDRPVQLTHPIAEVLQDLLFQPRQLAQFVQCGFGNWVMVSRF